MKRRERTNTNFLPRWAVIFPLTFVVIGIAVLIFLIHTKNDNEQFMKTAVPVQAECVDVWRTTSTDSDGDVTVEYHADIHYEYNGQSFDVHDFSIDSDTRKGDILTLYIDPAVPSDVRFEFTQTSFILGIVFIGVFILIALIMTIAIWKTSVFGKSANNNNTPSVSEPWEIK